MFRTNTIIFRKKTLIFGTNLVILYTHPVILKANPQIFRTNSVIFKKYRENTRKSQGYKREMKGKHMGLTKSLTKKAQFISWARL